MIYEAKEFKLKDSRICIIRSPKEEEALEMMDCLKMVASETDFILRYPEECTETYEEEAQFLRSINNSLYNIMLVGIIDGEIVGNAQLSIHRRMKVRHKASIAIGLRKKFWNLGIAKIMFEELEKIAINMQCKQIELEVIDINYRAIAFYEKMGYKKFATRPRGIILKDGTELDESFMVKYLD
ncbi:MAG: GNAT family N-acetyltransferase [Bacilli bacterium]|nr:GNAT family N-acetyltransferase [Bacilli bacterium]